MKYFTVFTAAALIATSAQAAKSAAYDTSYLTASLGWYDFIDQEDESAIGGLEYRFSPVEFGFRPMVGISATSDSAVYAYAGFHWDVEVLPRELYLSPNFAVGAYGEGDGKDLGGALEFRSGLELGYQFDNRHRLGLSINHLSNASIYDKNPGVETLIVTYSIPTGSLF